MSGRRGTVSGGDGIHCLTLTSQNREETVYFLPVFKTSVLDRIRSIGSLYPVLFSRRNLVSRVFSYQEGGGPAVDRRDPVPAGDPRFPRNPGKPEGPDRVSPESSVTFPVFRYPLPFQSRRRRTLALPSSFSLRIFRAGRPWKSLPRQPWNSRPWTTDVLV